MVTELKDNWYEVLSKERIAVVKCYATWCGPCKFYGPHFQKFSENLPVYMGAEVGYYQANNDKLLDLKERYDIDRLPSTIFLIHGVLVRKMYGVTRQSVFENVLEQSLKIPYHIKREMK